MQWQRKNQFPDKNYLKSVLEKAAYEKDMTEKEARLEMIISKNILVMEE